MDEGHRGTTNRNALRSGGLLGSVASRSRSDWPLVLAASLLLACSTSLIASAVTYSESVTLGGFHKVLRAASPGATAVRVYASVAAGDLASADAAVRPVIAAGLGSGRGSTSLVVTTDVLSLAQYDASDSQHQILVGSFGDIERHARLTAGIWPADEPRAPDDPCATISAGGRPAIEAALSEGAAAALGLGPGSEVSLSNKLGAAQRSELCVSGIYAPDPDDRYWVGDDLELTGVQAVGQSITRGPLVVTPAALGTLAGPANLTAEWRWLPAIESIGPGEAGDLKDAITALKDQVQAALPKAYVWQTTGLADVLAAAAKSLLVAQSSSLLLFIQFVVLAVYAILLVGGMLVERRRPEAALLRSRGASWPHLALLAAGEALLLAVPAVAIAPLAAQAVVRLLIAAGPLAGEHVLEPVGIDPPTMLGAGLAGLGCVAVLTIPSLPSIGSLSGVRASLSRQLGRTLAQRLGLDLILVALAAVALWQLQSYGSPLTTTVRGNLGIDPLLVAAPAIGLLAGALVATRLVPRMGELAERALERPTGLAASFLARQMARRPLRYTRISLLVMLAAAMATFAAAFAATWSSSQAEQAAYQTGGDIRVSIADRPTTPLWSLPQLYGAIPGVESTASVGRGRFDVGNHLGAGQLLTVQPGALAQSSLTVSGTEGLGAQVNALGADAPPSGASGAPGTPGTLAASGGGVQTADRSILLPGRPTRLEVALRLDLDLEASPFGDPPFDPTQGQVASFALSAVVSDSGGVYRLGGDTFDWSPGAGAVAPTLGVDLTATTGAGALRFADQIRLAGIEIGVTGPPVGDLIGTVEILSVRVANEGSGDWTDVAGVPSDGWTWSEVIRDQAAAYAGPPGRPGLLSLGAAADQASPIYLAGSGADAVVLRYAADPATSPISGIANDRLLQATGARVGDTILIGRDGYDTRVRITSMASIFPTLDPSQPFLVVDTAALARSDYENYGLFTASQEVWLKVAPADAGGVAATLGGGVYSVSALSSRTEIEQAGRADPIALGVIGALFVGSIAALILAAIGIVVNAAFAVRERSGELAVLRAVGERPGTLVRMLALEQALLLAYGMLGGVVLGLVLGWLAIPFAWLTPAGTVPVPAPAIVVPWLELAGVALPGSLLLIAVSTLLVRAAVAQPPAEVLRRQDVAP